MAGFIKLSKEDVAEKDFQIEYKGYKVEEVDAFLDTIVEDYKTFQQQQIENENKIKKYEEEVKRLADENSQIIATLEVSQKQLDELAGKGLNNAAVIKRIAELEKKTK